MDIEKLKTQPKVIFTNEDHYFATFLKAFNTKGQFSNGVKSLRCKKSAVSLSVGNRFKKTELEFSPYEGFYSVDWKGE